MKTSFFGEKSLKTLRFEVSELRLWMIHYNRLARLQKTFRTYSLRFNNRCIENSFGAVLTLEKKFWLVGIAGWLAIQAPLGFQPLLTLISWNIDVQSLGFLIGTLLGVFVQIVIISFASSWIWKKYKARKETQA